MIIKWYFIKIKEHKDDKFIFMIKLSKDKLRELIYLKRILKIKRLLDGRGCLIKLLSKMYKINFDFLLKVKIYKQN